MSKRSERSAAKEQYWREVIDGWRRSGGSVRQWCTQRQISEPSFYSWRKTLAKRNIAMAPQQPPRRRTRRKRGPAAMIPVEIVPPSNQPPLASLEIILSGGVQVLVRAHCQPALLREALVALRSEREESASC